MRKILLLSDTHSHVDQAICNHADWADEIWHAGDIGDLSVTDRLGALKPLRAVWGNIDNAQARVTFPKDAVFECEGVRVWITHIGGYPGKYPVQIRQKIIELKPQLFICGHSHILKVMYDKTFGLLHMNPGAAGKSGFHQVRTMLRFTIENGSVKNLEIVELGDRATPVGEGR